MGFWEALCNAWGWVRERAAALKPCRVNASQVFWFFAATLAWTLSAWYWARVMLFLKQRMEAQLVQRTCGRSARSSGPRTGYRATAHRLSTSD
ncbi:MAG TPA: hypothetical protein VEQ87_09310 [Burkholderiales bacterium]|nr:hypothetical protein [Burkholderiales bacterium]